MFYPAYLNLQNRKCLVVGAGLVAERKVLSLMRSGGDVTLISPEATQANADLAQNNQITWHKRQFRYGDTEGMFLVCAATDLPEINTQVFKEAHEVYGINLVNVVDVIPECTFAAASVITHQDLTISISTSGKSPALSRRIREYLEAKFGAVSLYDEPSETNFNLSFKGDGLPYPVYFLLEDRHCVVISDSEEMRTPLAQRLDLLLGCGASVDRVAPNPDNLERVSDAFLVLVDDFASGDFAFADHNQHQLIEFINTPEFSTFTTPSLVRDGDLIISISANHIQEIDKGVNGNCKIESVQAQLAHQFENNGYGEFIDFLGSLRPTVMESIPTQKGRQRYFDHLIDHVPGDERQQCCLGFENLNCAVKCTFNTIRNGQIDVVRQYALQQTRR
jgi:siroheme synthase-like protein